MTFDTYANLQTEILAKLNRAADSDAVTRVVSWITLAEDEMRMALTRLMVYQGETKNDAFSISAEYTVLPSGFFRARNLVINSVTPYINMDYIPPKQVDQLDPYAIADRPRHYTIQGGQLRVIPPPDTTYTASFTYYALPSLSNSQTTNWLLTAHPKLYFIAALAEAYAYYDDGDKWMAAQQDRDRLLSAIYTSDGSDQQGVNMRIRVDNGTP
jgi:hypothetical protein